MKTLITEEYFTRAVGHAPQRDDLERCNCDKAGELGHWQCGWCWHCDKPQFICGCRIFKEHCR